MKFYNHDTEITFGNYSGLTLAQVFEVNKSYIEWCLQNLDHFMISDESLEDLYQMFPGVELSDEAENARTVKLEEYETDSQFEDEDDDYEPMDGYGTSGEKYGWYNGHSDDVIDDAFEGDPEATWNID